MKKTISKIQTRSYCWLPLIVMCSILPAKADIMTFTVTSSGHNGSLTVHGFDSSLGTLTGVGVEGSFSDNVAINNVSRTDLQVDTRATVDGQLDLPGGGDLPFEEIQGLEGTISSFGSLEEHMSIPFGLGSPETSGLSAYTAPTVSFDYAGFLSLSSALPLGLAETDSAGISLTVSYDYTPAVSAVPEPAAVFLLGTMAAVFVWGARKRRLRAQ